MAKRERNYLPRVKQSATFQAQIEDIRATECPRLREVKMVRVWREHYPLAKAIQRMFYKPQYVTVTFADAQSFLWEGIIKTVEKWDHARGWGAASYCVEHTKWAVINSCKTTRDARNEYKKVFGKYPEPNANLADYADDIDALVQNTYEEFYGNKEEESEEEAGYYNTPAERLKGSRAAQKRLKHMRERSDKNRRKKEESDTTKASR